MRSVRVGWSGKCFIKLTTAVPRRHDMTVILCACRHGCEESPVGDKPGHILFFCSFLFSLRSLKREWRTLDLNGPGMQMKEINPPTNYCFSLQRRKIRLHGDVTARCGMENQKTVLEGSAYLKAVYCGRYQAARWTLSPSCPVPVWKAPPPGLQIVKAGSNGRTEPSFPSPPLTDFVGPRR